ncbi:hypothetical protein CRG98_001422 [Punica granatum]|uniref:Uncharacterized protein n=1 Tax=Punica granatum TaxID=22663 RepID=A0A2I0LBY5_PUNGR|nr:hypothetical protein CRG98_001422 [Punica granatum]
MSVTRPHGKVDTPKPRDPKARMRVPTRVHIRWDVIVSIWVISARKGYQTPNVSYLSPFDVGADLRTNPFEERGNDMIQLGDPLHGHDRMTGCGMKSSIETCMC